MGFDDPAQTGLALGAIAAFVGATGINARFSGDFDKQRFEIQAAAKGRTTVFAVLLPLLKLALAKPVRKVIWKYIFKK